jgi:signal transduction histidine kinase
MTTANDRNARAQRMTPISQRMQTLREVVLDEWVQQVRRKVASAAALAHPILIDTFPALYDNLAEALTPNYPRTGAAIATSSVALEHGSERARLSKYDVESVIVEYQLLRETICRVLRRDGAAIGEQEAEIIDAAFDTAIREAVTAFALAQAAFRERFFAALAHDLRGPLANATMSAELIRKTGDFAMIHGLADNIVESLGRVDQMIGQLLDTLLVEHGERLPIEPSNFDLQDVVAEVCEQMTLVHGPRFQVEGGSVRGWWGRNEIQRALENLIGNALKYGAPDQPIRITCSSAHGRVMLSVHNEGAPIPADQVESVFQVFRRAAAATESPAQGWGIGLPYVRSVAESHGGSIGVDSAPGRGTTFTIDIPLDMRAFLDAPVL